MPPKDMSSIPLPNLLCKHLRYVQDLLINANEIQTPYDKHHKVSSLVKKITKTHTILSNMKKYENVK